MAFSAKEARAEVLRQAGGLVFARRETDDAGQGQSGVGSSASKVRSARSFGRPVASLFAHDRVTNGLRGAGQDVEGSDDRLVFELVVEREVAVVIVRCPRWHRPRFNCRDGGRTPCGNPLPRIKSHGSRAASGVAASAVLFDERAEVPAIGQRTDQLGVPSGRAPPSALASTGDSSDSHEASVAKTIRTERNERREYDRMRCVGARGSGDATRWTWPTLD